MLLKDGKVNTKQANILARKHLYTTYDLAEFGPIHYTDYRKIKNLNECMHGENAAICGTLTKIEKKKTNDYRRSYIYGRICQNDGIDAALFSFGELHKMHLYENLVGQEIVICGKVSYSHNYGYAINNPDFIFEKNAFKPYIKRTYTKFSGMSEEKLWELIKDSIDMVEEPLEKEVLERDHVPSYTDSLWMIHNPKEPDDVRKGLKRVLYDELLYLALMLQKDSEQTSEKAPAFRKRELLNRFSAELPFALTGDQFSAVQTMLDLTKKETALDVILQGDVGCGKTIVAACMMICTAENGYQSVLMAPRTVLAKQHYDEISGYAQKMGLTCVFLHSGMKAKERNAALESIRNGSTKLIVGTHSCIGQDVMYHKLGLMVADEEHLFGVSQKEAIRKKSEQGIHYISMSATPIPRTIANALYGDRKKILYIKEKPAGRLPIATWINNRREELFRFMEGQIREGHQSYVVCPAIEENEDSGIVSIESVEKEYRKYFDSRGIRIGVVNGKMKKDDTERIMKDYANNVIQILISTTVIEVGVNVPNATVMVIEQADRFGLASLHQLRGRVGRSELQSYCCLFSEETANERLQVLTQTNDGFLIAEADLMQRGTGNLIGKEQSGMNRFVNQMIRYPKLYERIKETAAYCEEHGYGSKLIRRYEEHELAKNGGGE